MLSALRPIASRRFCSCCSGLCHVRLRPLLLLLLLLASAGTSFAQSTIVVPNAGFETPSIGSGGGAYTYNPSGASWSFVGNAGLTGNASGFTSGNPAAPEGSQVAFVQITGTISQSLTGFQAGTAYTLTVSAAQRGNNGTSTQAVQVSMDGTVIGAITPSSTNYSNSTFSYTPQASGAHTLQFLGLNPNGGDNTVFLDNVRVTAAQAPSQPTPYGGAAVTVAPSGTTKVEAENYDLGGEGVAYHDTDNGGSTLYRSDNVGIDAVASASNGYGVGSTAGGEWDGYTISVASAGTYTLSASVSSPTPGGTFHLEFGPVGQVGGSGIIQSGEFTVPNTGSYTVFQPVTVPGVSLPAGRLWMRLVLDSAYPCIFDYFTLSPAVTSVLTSIAISPASSTLSTGGTQQFTAVAKDQNGNALSPQPAFTWSVASGGVGTISSSGLYSAGMTAGSATVKATTGGVSGSTVKATTGGVSGSAVVTVTAPAPIRPTPYGGSAATVAPSGTTRVEAENYDLGGEGIAYHDTDNGGQTGYRSDNIGVYPDGGASNGYAVGWAAAGEWDGYTLNVAKAGVYTVGALVATPSGGGTFHLEFGPVGQVGGAGVIQSGEFTCPNTGGWGGSYQPVAVATVTLPAGPLWMRLVVDSQYACNFDCFTLTAMPTLTSIAVSPASASLSLNGTKQFTASAKDQNGNSLSPQPAFTWSVANGGVGTIGSSTGLYSAGTTAGSATVTAMNGTVSGGAAVTVTGNPSFSLSPSSGGLSIVQGSNGLLSVSLINSGGFSGSVALVASGLPAGVSASFSPASISGTATSTLTLTAAPTAATGSVNITIIGTSGSTSQITTVALTVTAVPILTSIVVSPNPFNLVMNGTQQFTAVANNQNGTPMSPQPTFTWSQGLQAGGGSIGSISSTGLYTAGPAPGTTTIAATSGSMTGTAAVNVTASTDFTLTTSTPTFTLSGGSSSPSSGLALITSGQATASVLITPIGSFGGAVSLTVSGLPGGIAYGFSSASPITVTSGTPTADTLIVQANGALPGMYPLTITATSGTYTHTLSLTLIVTPSGTVSQVSLTDLSMPPAALIQWPAGTHQTNLYGVTRNGSSMPQYQSNNLYVFDNTIQIGTPYTYQVTNTWTDPPVYFVVNGINYIYIPHGVDIMGTINVTPEQVIVSDNQAVDARYDPRYSTWTFIDHNFGVTTYRGGLFVGYNADNSQVGHSYLKFSLPPVPTGKTLWPVSSVNAYFTRCYAAGTAVVACQTVPSTWSGSTITWDTAPPLAAASTATTMPIDYVSYDGVKAFPFWVHWGMGSAIISALTGGGGNYAAALNGMNEPTFGAGGPVTNGSSTVWAYFDKKESLDNQPACILYAYSN